MCHTTWSVVGDRDAEAAVGDLLELVPVVVQRGVDVDGDAHLAEGSTVERDAQSTRRQVHRRAAAPRDRLGLRPPRARGVARHRLGSATSTGSRSTGARPTTSSSATGPALVFVHGLGASWQSWLENIPEFARDHRVVAMDLPGFGYSEHARPATSRSSTTRAGPSGCWTRSGSTPARWWATRWAASSPPRWRSAAPSACRASPSSPPPCSGRATAARSRSCGLARLSDAYVARALDALDRRGRDAARACARGRSPRPASATRT